MYGLIDEATRPTLPIMSPSVHLWSRIGLNVQSSNA